MTHNHVKFDLVLYHGGCPDGFTAAWVFKNKFPTIYTKGCSYGDAKPNVKGRNVAVVDFSFPRKETIEMFNEANYMVVLDHHQSAKDNLENLNIDPRKGQVIFDMDRSGAQIAWDYLNDNKKRHWLIEYVADRDLWKRELPYSEELSFALWFDGYFNDFNKLENLIEKVPRLINLESQPIIKRGQLLVTSKNLDIKAYVNMSVPAKLKLPLKTLDVRIVCCPRQYRSDVGNEINQKFLDIDCAAIYWYNHSTDRWWISLRARQNSNINLSELTNNLETGGGHPKAAGFSINKGNLNSYFELENVVCESPKPIPLPILKDYLDKEIQDYVNTVKDNKFHFDDRSYQVKMTCTPIHYQRLILDEMKKIYKNTINVVFWYDYARNLWTIRMYTNKYNLMNLLGPYPEKFLGNLPDLLSNNTLYWSFVEDEEYKFQKIFYN